MKCLESITKICCLVRAMIMDQSSYAMILEEVDGWEE